MAKFLMLGRYSTEGIKGITTERTQKVIDAIKRLDGKVDLMYALMGSYDVAFAVDFPEHNEALEASLVLTKLTNINFTTFPAFTIEEFDKVAEQANKITSRDL